MEINKCNDKGQPHGYWEEKNGQILIKGNYINGLKIGTWVKHEIIMGEEKLIKCKIFYELDRLPFYLWYHRFNNSIEYEAQNEHCYYSIHEEEIYE